MSNWTSKHAYKSRSTIYFGAARRASRVSRTQVPARLTIRRVNVLIFVFSHLKSYFCFCLFHRSLARTLFALNGRRRLSSEKAHIYAIQQSQSGHQFANDRSCCCSNGSGLVSVNSKFRFHCPHTNAFTHTRSHGYCTELLRCQINIGSPKHTKRMCGTRRAECIWIAHCSLCFINNGNYTIARVGRFKFTCH